MKSAQSAGISKMRSTEHHNQFPAHYLLVRAPFEEGYSGDRQESALATVACLSLCLVDQLHKPLISETALAAAQLGQRLKQGIGWLGVCDLKRTAV